MSNERHEDHHHLQGGRYQAASGTLASAASYVARSASTGGAGDGSGASFATSFEAILAWGEANNLILLPEEFSFFKRLPDASGNEHEVWFDELSNRWFKATYPDHFGIAWGREGSAWPCEYLTRLLLQNKYFGDDIRLVALINDRKHLRVLTSQPHIAGESAPYAEIQKWFCDLGFCRLECRGCVAWYLKQENLLVADAHEGNVIRTPKGTLIAIDLNIMQPAGELLEWVLSEIEK